MGSVRTGGAKSRGLRGLGASRKTNGTCTCWTSTAKESSRTARSGLSPSIQSIRPQLNWITKTAVVGKMAPSQFTARSRNAFHYAGLGRYRW